MVVGGFLFRTSHCFQIPNMSYQNCFDELRYFFVVVARIPRDGRTVRDILSSFQ